MTTAASRTTAEQIMTSNMLLLSGSIMVCTVSLTTGGRVNISVKAEFGAAAFTIGADFINENTI